MRETLIQWTVRHVLGHQREKGQSPFVGPLNRYAVLNDEMDVMAKYYRSTTSNIGMES
jgi:hypothetical protein